MNSDYVNRTGKVTYNSGPWNSFRGSRKAVAVPGTPRVGQLSDDLRALEKVQASRPLKPPTVKR